MNSHPTRQQFLQALAAVLAAPVSAAPARAADSPPPVDASHDMSMFPADWTRPDRIVMLLYPGFTALDFIGPQYFFASLMGATVHLAAKTLQPVMSDTRVALVPDTTFADCPETCDVLFLPGSGQGVLDALQDSATLDFIRSRGRNARYLASVCTGSLLLGAAGFLDGYQATSHWVARPLLHHFGAIETNRRVVIDRNRITAAGVSAGLDLGLHMTLLLRDEAYARGMQLLAEYAPEPPFQAGTPETALPRDLDLMRAMFQEFLAKAGPLCRRFQNQTHPGP